MNKDLSSIDGAKKNQKEALSPYKIGVLMFIQIFCSDTSSTDPVIEKRDFCIAALKCIQSPDLGINGFFRLIMSPTFKLSRLKLIVEAQMNTLVEDGVRKLLDLFDDLGNLMKPAVDNNPHIALLNKQSVLGLYVRRMIMLYEKLTFCKIVSLYEAFKLYYSELEDEGSMENIDKDGTILYSNNGWGGRQAELLVAQQAQALLNDEHKALPPAELQSLVKDLLNSSPYYSEAHYLSYLNCLRVNEYCGALDSLYHCFDRLAPLENRPTTDDKLRTFRYAALNLAALHAQFGYKELAQLALKEAIMLAQEAGDNVCLQLAHSWVYYLTSKNKKPLIERSIAKASGLNMTHTTSLALIASAHNFALEGKKPQQVFETLTKSDVLNNQHSMIDLISMIYAEKTALWAYYGKTEMSSVCAQLLLLFNSGEKKQLMFNGPSTCQAVVTVANILNELGEYNLSATVLAHAKERFPHQPSSRIWALSELLHEFSKLMRNEKWITAEEIALRMSSLDPVEGKFRLSEVLLAKHHYPEALKLAYEIDEMDDITPQQRVRAKLQINQIECSSIHPGAPESATNSILLLNSALDIAISNHLSYYRALVNMHLANVQLLLGMPFQALSIIKEPTIHILAHGGLYDQGRAHITYAKCLSANAENQTDSKNRGMMMEAIKHLRKAKHLFEKLEANNMIKSTLFLLGSYYNEIELDEERNKCAFEYRQLSQQFPMEKNHLFLF